MVPSYTLKAVLASDGVLLLPDSMAQALAYNGDGTLNYTEITNMSVTYRQTLTYTGGVITGISRWVAQ